MVGVWRMSFYKRLFQCLTTADEIVCCTYDEIRACIRVMWMESFSKNSESMSHDVRRTALCVVNINGTLNNEGNRNEKSEGEPLHWKHRRNQIAKMQLGKELIRSNRFSPFLWMLKVRVHNFVTNSFLFDTCAQHNFIPIDAVLCNNVIQWDSKRVYIWYISRWSIWLWRVTCMIRSVYRKCTACARKGLNTMQIILYGFQICDFQHYSRSVIIVLLHTHKKLRAKCKTWEESVHLIFHYAFFSFCVGLIFFVLFYVLFLSLQVSILSLFSQVDILDVTYHCNFSRTFHMRRSQFRIMSLWFNFFLHLWNHGTWNMVQYNFAPE